MPTRVTLATDCPISLNWLGYHKANSCWPQQPWFECNHCHHRRTISESGDTLEKPKQVRAFLYPLDHWRWGRHGNSGNTDCPVLSVCYVHYNSHTNKCLSSPPVLTYHLQPQLSGQGVSFLKIFPSKPPCTNCASISIYDSPLPMQPTAVVAWCYQFVGGALNSFEFTSWQAHSL